MCQRTNGCQTSASNPPNSKAFILRETVATSGRDPRPLVALKGPVRPEINAQLTTVFQSETRLRCHFLIPLIRYGVLRWGKRIQPGAAGPYKDSDVSLKEMKMFLSCLPPVTVPTRGAKFFVFLACSETMG